MIAAVAAVLEARSTELPAIGAASVAEAENRAAPLTCVVPACIFVAGCEVDKSVPKLALKVYFSL